MADVIRASLVPFTEPPMEIVNDRWYGPRGAFIERNPPNSGDSWILCCPKCGQMGSPREGQKWTVTGGSFDDVTTLTLSPSIAKSCCGWHGYLRNGVFEEC